MAGGESTADLEANIGGDAAAAEHPEETAHETRAAMPVTGGRPSPYQEASAMDDTLSGTRDAHGRRAAHQHHKYSEVKHGGDNLVPLDQQFGTWHDGSPESETAFGKRIVEKTRRAQARRHKQASERTS